MKAKQKRTTGLILMTVAFFIWIVDRFSHIVSTTMGQMICGDTYMKAVDGVVGDCSCGFNTDMYLTAILFALMLIGVILYLFSKRE
jgi:hypothetical protein